MSPYIDGFVLPIPKKLLPVYRTVARAAGRIWCEHGALAYFECAGDDMNAPGMVAFPKIAKAREDEVVVFAWAVFKSRRARDKANAAIMSDARIAKLGEKLKGVVNCKRMAYGGFNVLVQVAPRKG